MTLHAVDRNVAAPKLCARLSEALARIMDANRFISEKQNDWKELESLLDKVQDEGFSKLSFEEVQSFCRLYRKASSDLAQSKTSLANTEIIAYLNSLIARSYSHVYSTERSRLAEVSNFFQFGFPNLFRQTIKYTIFAAAIFIAAALLGFITCFLNRDALPYFVPPQFVAHFEKLGEGSEKNIGASLPPALASPLSAFIMTNNIKVSFIAFALGIFFGIGTFYAMVQNGLLIGALAAAFHRFELGLYFWALILPHGIIELTSIFIAGGAGFLLADAIFRPGNRFRQAALIQNGKLAVRLIFGIIPLLVMAGIIEGFITPVRVISPYAKLCFALLTAFFVFYYLFVVGNEKLSLISLFPTRRRRNA